MFHHPTGPKTTRFALCAITIATLISTESFAQNASKSISEGTMQNVTSELISRFGTSQASRIEKGVRQVTRLWRPEDGSEENFIQFCRDNFVADPDLLQKTFDRLQENLILVYGYMLELKRDIDRPLDLDLGPILPIDYLFGEFSPSAHLSEDLFKSKIAFIVLLNFPLYTLEERLTLAPSWTRQEWAETRLAQIFSTRVPASVKQKVTQAYTKADNYINSYNIFMHNVLTENGERLFPEGLKLISHWGLRDELKAQYANKDGLPRQEMIQLIMERIITQQIPSVVINNPDVDWNPSSNIVTLRSGSTRTSEREPDRRYTMWQNTFKAEREIDAYDLDAPTKIDRRFQRDREIPEAKVEQLLGSVLGSPVVKQVAAIIKKRLGRELRPFDIWYNGFKPRGAYTEQELDRIVASRYTTIPSFQADIANILKKLGFSGEKSQFLAAKIAVDPARGAGHAYRPGRLVDKAHLRTRIPQSGMNYKGYNIAIHELGHNVEQVISFNMIDYTLLRGVPNTAFTEGFAFVFQSRDLEILGVGKEEQHAEHLKALDVLWSTYEIGGVALVDMKAWRWLYEHPDATPAEMREAVIAIAKDVWNDYFAPVLGVRDVLLLAVYSHMVDGGMYTPDYPLGHIIAFQIEEHMKKYSLAEEMERMCMIGSITPDLWMEQAVGSSISTKPLLEAAERAVAVLKGK
ncbi:MAG: hypothetical protein ACE5H0_00200 [Bacteroidota bacterium]